MFGKLPKIPTELMLCFDDSDDENKTSTLIIFKTKISKKSQRKVETVLVVLPVAVFPDEASIAADIRKTGLKNFQLGIVSNVI